MSQNLAGSIYRSRMKGEGHRVSPSSMNTNADIKCSVHNACFGITNVLHKSYVLILCTRLVTNSNTLPNTYFCLSVADNSYRGRTNLTSTRPIHLVEFSLIMCITILQNVKI
jgi:hypothetical protein